MDAKRTHVHVGMCLFSYHYDVIVLNTRDITHVNNYNTTFNLLVFAIISVRLKSQS